jgi:hypothetical protein
LASGSSQVAVGHSFCIAACTINSIFRETTRVIWKVLKDKYVPPPTIETWRKNAEDFESLWQFPNCLGAIDGKHVVKMQGIYSYRLLA